MSHESSSFQKFLDWKNLGVWEVPKEKHSQCSKTNPLCGDEVIIYFRTTEKLGLRILGLGGESCSVCQAASGLLFKRNTEFLKSELQKEIESFQNFLETEEGHFLLNEDEESFFRLVKSSPNRIRCALLPWETAVKCLEGI